MAAPFGFSVSDFIAVGDLARKISIALSEARGAKAEYTSLIELLDSISNSLSTIRTYLASSSTFALLRVDQAFMNGLCFHADCCGKLMSTFLLDSKKYTEALFNGQGNKAKSTFRKIAWCMYRSDDVFKLEQRLQSHLDAFQRYLSAIHIHIQAQSAAKTENYLEGLGRTVNEIFTILKITQDNRPKMLGYPWEANDISTCISFEDALGRKLVLPTVLCRSLETFLDTLQLMFKDHPGYTKVQNGEFEIIHAVSGDRLFSQISIDQEGLRDESYWQTKVTPGTKLEMNIVRRKRVKAPEEELLSSIPNEVPCPSCGSKLYGVGFRKCATCDVNFRYSVVEEASQMHRFPWEKKWHRKSFLRKSPQQKFPLLLSQKEPEVLGPRRQEFDTTTTQRRLSMLNSATLSPDDDMKYFRRVHHVVQTAVPVSSMTNYFQYSRLPLFHAVGRGDARWVQEILLTSDTHPDERSFQGWTALQQACSANIGRVEAVAELLIKHGADVNAAPGNGYNMTALSAACRVGRKSLIELLLRHGADVNAPFSYFGESALSSACGGGHVDIVKLLIDHGARIVEDKEGFFSPMQNAAQSGNLDIVKLLVRSGANLHPNCGLNSGLFWGHDHIAKYLIDHGSDVNQLLDSSGFQQSHGLDQFRPIACAQTIGMVNLLVSHGADINGSIAEFEGASAVQQAAAHGSTEVLEELIRLGGDVNTPAAPGRGTTALQAAALCGRFRHVVLLIDKYKADVNAPRATRELGYTALEAAVSYVARTFSRDKRQPYPESEESEDEEELKESEEQEESEELEYQKESEKTEDKDYSDHQEDIEKLGAKLDVDDRIAMVKFLFERGGQLTPDMLHIAAAFGDNDLAELLLSKGANPLHPAGWFLNGECWGDDRPTGKTAFETGKLNHSLEHLDCLRSWERENMPTLGPA